MTPPVTTQAAKRAAFDWLHATKPLANQREHDLLSEAFAKAIAEERERAAKIADDEAARQVAASDEHRRESEATFYTATALVHAEHAVARSKMATCARSIATAIRATEVGNG